jgi:hypothetical protein
VIAHWAGSIEVRYPLAPRNKDGQFPKWEAVGVYSPAPDGKIYRSIIQSTPAIPSEIAEYEQAMEIALSNASSTPHSQKKAAKQTDSSQAPTRSLEQRRHSPCIVG